MRSARLYKSSRPEKNAPTPPTSTMANAPSLEKTVDQETLFRLALEGMRELFLAQNDMTRLSREVARLEDTLIRLRNPATWYLRVRRGEHVPQTRDRDFSAYVCCDSRMCVLGTLLAPRCDDGTLEPVPAALLLSSRGRVFVYDWDTDGMLLVAPSLSKFADRGLLLCETVYRHPSTERCTHEPADLISVLASCSDGAGLAAVCTTHRYREIVLKTPGRDTSLLRLLGSTDALMKHIPYCLLDQDGIDHFRKFISLTIRCPWYLVGATGRFHERDGFVPDTLILTDMFGVIYGIEHHGRHVYRLADDINMFLRAGTLKRYMSRFDRNYASEGRLEPLPSCHHPHWGYGDGLDFLKARGHQIERRDMEAALRWALCRGIYTTPAFGWENMDQIPLTELWHGMQQVIPPEDSPVKNQDRVTPGPWERRTVDDPDARLFRHVPIQPRNYVLNVSRATLEAADTREDALQLISSAKFVPEETCFRDEDGDSTSDDEVETESVPDLSGRQNWSESDVAADRIAAAIVLREGDLIRYSYFLPSMCPDEWFAYDP